MIKPVTLLVIVSIFTASCTDRSVEIHIDEDKKAIIACNGNILREVDIETPDTNVRYEGIDTIYFNKANSASRITVFNEVNNDYILRLKPNSRYEIKSRSSNGDQGVYRLVLETDSKANIIHSANSNCQ